jgi:hypothetical protein
MRGLDPRIHPLRLMDCRVKPGNDDVTGTPGAPRRGFIFSPKLVANFALPIAEDCRVKGVPARDPQKWEPVLRQIAR